MFWCDTGIPTIHKERQSYNEPELRLAGMSSWTHINEPKSELSNATVLWTVLYLNHDQSLNTHYLTSAYIILQK